MKPEEKNLSSSHVRMRRFAPIALVLAAVAAAVAAYMQALNYPFISDDGYYITKNTRLAGLHLTELWRLFTKPYNVFSEFLPLRDLSYWLDMTLFGLNPAAFRLHNIILYLLCLPLLYAVTSGLWRYFHPADIASAPWAAAATTALFALHPIMIEPVVWISGRKYLLASLFSMLALWFALRAKRELGLSAPYAAATLVAFLAVMLSKTSYVTVAPVIALLWLAFWLDIPATYRRHSHLLWLFAILLLAVLLNLVFIASKWGSTERLSYYFGIEAVSRTLAVLGWLARLSVSPESRHFFYPVLEDTYLPAMIVLGVATLAAAVAGTIMFLRKRSMESFAVASFFLLCLPYIQLIPFAAPSLVSDRWLALAAWPAVMLLTVLSWRLKPVPRAILLLTIALSWGFQNMERPRDWFSHEVLVDSDFRAFPGYYAPAIYKIFSVQLPQGLLREARDTADSITTPELQDITVRLIDADYAVANATGGPGEVVALLNKLGLALNKPPVQAKWNPPISSMWGRCRDIFAAQWDSLAKQFPDNASVRYNAGLWMAEDRRYINAIVHLRAAVDSQRLPEPMRGQAFYNLGLALMGSGYVAKAEAPLRAALEQTPPELRAYCLLSTVYKKTRRLKEAAGAEANCADRTLSDEAAK